MLLPGQVLLLIQLEPFNSVCCCQGKVYCFICLNLTLQVLLPGQVLLLLQLAACYFNTVAREDALPVQLPGQVMLVS
jgi:hypothetical protein